MPAETSAKIIAAAGLPLVANEELISAGHVKVNGTVVTELGTKPDPTLITFASMASCCRRAEPCLPAAE